MSGLGLGTESHLSIAGVSRVVEQYRARLVCDGGAAEPESGSLSALDGMLLSLYLQCRGEVSVVIDHAAGTTLGVSTLLCALRAEVATIRWPDSVGSEPEAVPGWMASLETWLGDQESSAALRIQSPRLRVLDSSGASVATVTADASSSATRTRVPMTEPSMAESVSLVDLNGFDAEMACQRLERASTDVTNGTMLVLGLGKLGRCPALQEAIDWASRRGWGIRLFREIGPMLGGSGLALLRAEVARDDEVLERVGGFFQGNFSFEGLLESTCRTVHAASMLEEPIKKQLRPANSPEGLDGERLVHLLRESLEECDQLRVDLRGKYSLRKMIRSRIAPDGTRRYAAIRPGLVVLNIVRFEGISGLLRFLYHRAWRRRAA